MNWKPINGYEGLYEVSDTGLVRSLKYGRTRVLSPRKNKGYLEVYLYKDRKRKTLLVHRLVANAFISNPLGLATVNHRDEDKTNNKVSNLEWMTMTENNRYGTRTLRLKNRPDVSKPVLQLDYLGNVVKQFPSLQEAERQTRISHGRISSACSGRYKTAGGFRWKYA